MSRIAEAAVLLGNERVVTGSCHNDIWAMIYAGNGYVREPGLEGFVTDSGRFVNRWTAATIARVAGQVRYGISDPKRGLSSSDLC